MSKLKVLIVEDSQLVSDILTEALQTDKQVAVVGVARNGVEALEMIPRLNPDLVTMDVWMPVMNGFTTVERIMADFPTPILVITSSNLKHDVQISLRMLAAGALDVIEKPSFSNNSQWERTCVELLAKVHLIASIKVVTHLRGKHLRSSGYSSVKAEEKPLTPLHSKPSPGARSENKSTKPLNITTFSSLASKPIIPTLFPNEQPNPTFPVVPFYQVIAIASSTGGPSALLKILQSLPSNFPVAILIVQHISEGFARGLVEWLQRETSLKVCIASSNDKIQPGKVFIAPDRRNLVVNPLANHFLALNDEGEDFMRPNADILLNSVATAFKERAIGIVLTGMGSDGAKGLKEMALRGAHTIAQDENTSLIYGMPKVASEIGAAKQVLPLGQIGSTLIKLLQIPF